MSLDTLHVTKSCENSENEDSRFYIASMPCNSATKIGGLNTNMVTHIDSKKKCYVLEKMVFILIEQNHVLFVPQAFLQYLIQNIFTIFNPKPFYTI